MLDLDSDRSRHGATYVLVSLSIVVVLIFTLFHKGRSVGMIAAQQRRAMPPLTLQLLNGGLWRLEDHRNEVIAINYWASWCAPCWEETPALIHLSRELGPHGFVVVGIAMDERNSNDVPHDVRRFVDTLHVPYAIALNPPMSQLAYGMDGLPATLLIDREGRIARSYIGAIHETILRKDVEALLREPLIPLQ